ncbi:LysR family transcriptional regulator [Paraburkholderia caffeinilytica]|uniref:LysR family transcriptional regulator n=1 Tax=Paraburkholderia caffeinilytica TaxID=1761016 RepID=UPI003DA0E2D1
MQTNSGASARVLINLRQLEVLRAVMRYRTTIGAAEELGMSQPAVSNAIRLAEAKLGFPLFDRVSNRLIPTAEAKLLLDDAEPLFLVHQAIQQKAWDLRTGRAGVLRIFATAELSEWLVPKVLSRFALDHPRAKIYLETLRVDSMIENLDSGMADIGLAMMAPSPASLVNELLAEFEVMCAVPPGDPLAACTCVTPGDLDGRRLIGPPAGSPLGRLIERGHEANGSWFAADIEVRFSNIACRLVREGLGTALVDELSIHAQPPDSLVVRPFRPRLPVPLSALLPGNRPRQRLAESFIRHVRAVVGEIARVRPDTA